MSNGITKLNNQLKKGITKVEPGKDRSGFSKGNMKRHATGSIVEEGYGKIFRYSSAGICISSPEGSFIIVNPAFCRFLGYTENELMGLSADEIIHPDDLERARRSRKNARPGDSAGFSREERYRRKDGSTIWGQVSDDWFFKADGTPSYVLTIVQDISEKKPVETASMEPDAKLALRVAELEAANMELESFNYTVSHDLRSPLTTIGGFCELLLGLGKSHLDEQCKSIIRHMRGTVRHMDQLIETLLNFSRLSNRDLSREKVNLSQFASRLAVQLRMREPQRQIEFNIAQRAVVEGDPKLLMEVMGNLLDNAWKYTSKQEKTQIEFGRMETEGSVTYFVRDNGPGFAMAQAERIFSPFLRLHSREEFAGFGIGLSTARRIIQRHGGRIWAEGIPGHGATFYFTLP